MLGASRKVSAAAPVFSFAHRRLLWQAVLKSADYVCLCWVVCLHAVYGTCVPAGLLQL
jgi:hypothetical protein